MKTVTPDGILTLDAPELRRRSAIIVNRLRECIEVCKRVLLEKFQDTQCDAAGKLSQSIYVVESLLGKCHQEGDLLFFTIRQDPPVSQLLYSVYCADIVVYHIIFRNPDGEILGFVCPNSADLLPSRCPPCLHPTPSGLRHCWALHRRRQLPISVAQSYYQRPLRRRHHA